MEHSAQINTFKIAEKTTVTIVWKLILTGYAAIKCMCVFSQFQVSIASRLVYTCISQKASAAAAFCLVKFF